MQRYTLKLNFQIKFYFFIENLCFCSLKIAVCAPKITAESKNCRLKITIISKNYRLKIPVRVRVYARIYARAYDCGQIVIRTHDHDQHTNGTHDHRKREDSGKAEKPEYICMFAGNEKKVQKKSRKIWKYEKRL